jgi:hypothetical protein
MRIPMIDESDKGQRKGRAIVEPCLDHSIVYKRDSLLLLPLIVGYGHRYSLI